MIRTCQKTDVHLLVNDNSHHYRLIMAALYMIECLFQSRCLFVRGNNFLISCISASHFSKPSIDGGLRLSSCGFIISAVI